MMNSSLFTINHDELSRTTINHKLTITTHLLTIYFITCITHHLSIITHHIPSTIINPLLGHLSTIHQLSNQDLADTWHQLTAAPACLSMSQLLHVLHLQQTADGWRQDRSPLGTMGTKAVAIGTNAVDAAPRFHHMNRHLKRRRMVDWVDWVVF